MSGGVRLAEERVPRSSAAQAPATVMLERLRRVREFSFEARWLDADGSFVTGHGAGRTTVREDGDQALVVDERGRWESRPGQTLRFHGGYRWSVEGERLSVAHLRRGENHPVALVDLVPSADGAWRSVQPFLCGGDEYSAHLRPDGAHTVFRWMVRGPRKAYTLAIRYHAAPDPSGPGEG